jgi:hypothetical protein
MRKSDDPTLRDYEDYIASALRTEGGHLSIGRGGFTLFYASGARLSPKSPTRAASCFLTNMPASTPPPLRAGRPTRSTICHSPVPRPSSSAAAHGQ